MDRILLVILNEVGYIYVRAVCLSGQHAVSVVLDDCDAVDSAENHKISGFVIKACTVRVFQNIKSGELVEGESVIIGAVKRDDAGVVADPYILSVVADDTMSRSLGNMFRLMENLVFGRIYDKSVSCGEKHIVSACYVECLVDCETAACWELNDMRLTGPGVVFENSVLSAAEPYSGVVLDCRRKKVCPFVECLAEFLRFYLCHDGRSVQDAIGTSECSQSLCGNP